MAIVADVRYGLRLLRRSPVFALTSIASLAIGIGASAAIVSLTDALLFAPTAGVRRGPRTRLLGTGHPSRRHRSRDSAQG